MNIYKSQVNENPSQSKLTSSDLKDAKSIMKLEKIGLRGRINNAIKINLQHFKVLKNSLDEISFRFIAFLIKGFFLNLKKDYENFSKDLEYFLEIYISGGIKIPKEKQIRKKRTKNESQKIVSLGNLSFFTQFSEFDKLFNEAFDEKKLAETLNKINKKFKDPDFLKLDDRTKKEYFRKFIIEPLSGSLPFTQIFNNFEDNLFTENPSSFAEYINFDLGDSNRKEKKTSMRKSKLKTESNNADNVAEPLDINALDNMFDETEPNLKLNNNDTNLLNDVFFQDKTKNVIFNELVEVDELSLNNLLENCSYKNPYLRLDNDINWKIELPNFSFNKNSLKNQNSQSQNHAKMCEEAYLQFNKHFKKIIINSHLEKLKKNFGISVNKPALKSSNKKNQKADNKSNLERKLTCLIFASFEEEEEIMKKIENDNLNCKRLFDFIPNDDMRLENNLFDMSNEINNDLDISKMKFQENVSKPQIFINLEDANNSVFGSKNKSPEIIDIYKQENSKSINDSIQSLLLEELKESMNFSDMEFLKFSDLIKKNLKEFNLNTSEAMALAFYNCLIVTQLENLDIRQNKPFSGIYTTLETS